MCAADFISSLTFATCNRQRVQSSELTIAVPATQYFAEMTNAEHRCWWRNKACEKRLQLHAQLGRQLRFKFLTD